MISAASDERRTAGVRCGVPLQVPSGTMNYESSIFRDRPTKAEPSWLAI